MTDMRVTVQLPASLRCRTEAGETADDSGNSEPPFQVIVPFTTPELARAALHAASGWAYGLGAEVVLLAVREVPFPLPLDCPHFQPEFFCKQLAVLMEGFTFPVRVELKLTRNQREALQRSIPAASVVVIATKNRWWNTKEKRLARFLKRTGFTVSLLRLQFPGKALPASASLKTSPSESQRSEVEKINHA